ncbi:MULTISPECIES: NAD(P)/FAD-dependent oxidoreductase [Gordonia]|uniref:NAD(P)/FAD-dependent oxidoreductase n=1 Tax=Gordonia TaxID=2053 RepID=UPI0004B36A12|nr:MULTISPECIES: FAD-dependent oxidoreductase [Gordonia]MDH3022024.1 FAD-dependent oxidoreductase [Gordonia alkanivorans]MDJ0009675.1 FAD-dependent oxidoreductase [Gordonia alkanivorans]MDJ0029022.1 FAD-dependent oxidoreductase [Gordonia alkanivorans]MDJ0099448.1 FAD-dependent oxidoreductase [Gordonia alkanivorans]MDJ0495221.1 FAD-dependent oxidoreductase [Gordonia alkanivorans]
MSAGRVVIAGGGLAGMRTAETLRTKGFDGDVVIVSQEELPAYNRPPLSKSALHRDITAADVGLRMRKGVEFEWRLGTSVVEADLAAARVRLSDDTTVEYDHLVAATGVRPRRLDLPGPDLSGPTGGRHVLRTVADAQALARTLDGPRVVAILGAGFLGTELAWTLAGQGHTVTVVAPEAEPLVGALGAAAATSLRRRSEAAGVTFRTGRTASHLLGDNALRSVVLDDGSEVVASIVIEAVGSVPNVEWLATTPLDVNFGVPVDDTLRVVDALNVWAVGDVAWAPQSLLGGLRRRLEHWTHAGESARHVASSIIGTSSTFGSVPGFWTEQGGIRLDGYGFPGAADDHILTAGDWDGQFLARCEKDGELVGVLSVGFVKESAPLVRELTEQVAAAPA